MPDGAQGHTTTWHIYNQNVDNKGSTKFNQIKSNVLFFIVGRKGKKKVQLANSSRGINGGAIFSIFTY